MLWIILVAGIIIAWAALSCVASERAQRLQEFASIAEADKSPDSH
jgi:hypothetical protein